ncbi:MAG: 6-carboxytetrahydropterin synthase [Acidobacteria bacterium]|nr:MAG: 6-carboxytetrahydropterin synthase [Acidobacteriota bacterium]
MHTIVKRLSFCYGHRLMDYGGKCRHPHGHNGLLEIELAGEALDPRGMLIDFGEVKAQLVRFVDEELDHRMLLRQDDPLVKALSDLGEAPFVMSDNPTAENIAKLVFQQAELKKLPIVAVRLWETSDAFAEYRR